jgi:pyruvate/2-oxoglutarate dehydrogenase complex dihydrolipoamide acyltransferase (E2) component
MLTPDPRPPTPSAPPTAIPLPDLGTAGEAVRVSAWFVDPGELVEAGDPILEVVMPGMTCDVCSPFSGRLVRILKDIDAMVLPGDEVAWVDVTA